MCVYVCASERVHVTSKCKVLGAPGVGAPTHLFHGTHAGQASAPHALAGGGVMFLLVKTSNPGPTLVSSEEVKKAKADQTILNIGS